VIGHRGAAAVAPENTVAGLEAAVAAGADMVEFDVGEGLVLEHPGVPSDTPTTLDDALAYLSGETIGVLIDLKHEGIEADVAAAVRRHELGGTVIACSTRPAALRRLESSDPGLIRAISYPYDRHGAAGLPWPRAIVSSGAACLRPAMRARLIPLLRAAAAQVLSVRHELVGRSLAEAAHARGASVVAWTVNDPAALRRLAAAGVDAIVSDDPGMALRVLATLNSP